MDDIKLNNEEQALDNAPPSYEIIVAESKELTVLEPQELTVAEKPSKKNKKAPRALTTLSLVFTLLSLPCALFGLVPFQIFFIFLGFILYVIDRKKNGKRGISLFGMVCTLATFIIIFINYHKSPI